MRQVPNFYHFVLRLGQSFDLEKEPMELKRMQIRLVIIFFNLTEGIRLENLVFDILLHCTYLLLSIILHQYIHIYYHLCVYIELYIR